MSLHRVSTKKLITPRAPSTIPEVQYPSNWFKDHAGSKPIFNISVVCENLAAARSVLRKQISDNNVDIDVCKTFLYFYADTIKATLEEEWKSYELVIGQKDEIISPLSIVSVQKKVGSKEVVTTTADEKDDPWMAGYVLSIYRLIKANVSDYRSMIIERVSNQLKALCSSAPVVSDVVDIYRGWIADKGYDQLVAIYDMFFHRFPNHPLSSLRIGTTGSRFRDCSALISYGYLMNLLGMDKTTDVMDWVFVEQVGNDIDRMMTSEDELVEQFSYFPYHVDLGLVNKSAFSATANPHFFEWVHMIGTLVRAPRSLNARHISDSRSMDLLANAACVAFTYSKNFTFTKVYTETGKDADEEEQDGGGHPDYQEMDEYESALKSKDPTIWFLMLKGSNGNLPQPVRDFVASKGRASGEVREGTMEEYVSELSKLYV